MGAVRLALICVCILICLHSSKSQEGLGKIKTIVVIYAENRSFDHLYGFFPGATGIANATEEQKTQLDHDGVPLPHLTIFDHHGRSDPRFPPTRMWQWAREYTLADNFFMAAFGGSYLNHLWLVCACTPQHPGPPDSMYARLDQDGRLTKKPDSPSANEGAVQVYSASGGQVSPDGYSVNTTQPPYQPSGIPPQAEGDRDLADPNGTSRWHAPLPAQIARTIGDTLSAKGVSWAWYAGGWNLALDDGRQPPQEKRKIIYTAEDGQPLFRASPPALQLFRSLCPRNGGPCEASQGWGGLHPTYGRRVAPTGGVL